MIAIVIVLLPRAGRRLAVRPGLDVAAHGQDQALGRRRDLGNSSVEGGGVPSRWRSEAADLANVLARGRLDLAGGRGVVLVTEGSNASTHARSVPQHS
jgi:hypothetical protein